MATAAASGRLTRTRHEPHAELRAARKRVCAVACARPAWLVLAAVILAAAALRLIPWLARFPLHHDEALYGAWARLITTGRDPLLLTPWVDKPPLNLYLIAASFRLLGISELTLRLPGMVAGLLTVWATYGLALKMDIAGCCAPGQASASGFSEQMDMPGAAGNTAPAGENAAEHPERRAAARSRRMRSGHRARPHPSTGHCSLSTLTRRPAQDACSFSEQRRAALLAAALLALSPFAVLFSPTAFTDPWLTLWLVAAAWAALSERPLVAGLFAGLAVASKQQGVFVIPLVLVLLIGRGASARHTLRQIALAAFGFALAFGPLTWWDSLRWHNRPSFWERSLDTYGGLGLAAPAAWSGRAVEWAEPLGYLFGTPALSAVILALAVLGSISGARPARILGLFVTGYLALHVAFTFQPWDRYLLPILPLVCVLAARGIATAVRWLHNQVSEETRMNADERGKTAESALVRARPRPLMVVLSPIAIALAVSVAHAAWLGAAGRIPVGSDYGAYRGVDRAAAALAALPSDAVIYHRSLGWHLDFYLFDAPQERRWYDNAQKLATDAGRTARAEPIRPQWLVLPAWETPDVAALQAALAGQGLRLVARDRIVRDAGQPAFTLHQVAPIAARGEP